MTSDIRTCPVCEHRQKRDDPSRHVCAQVLRETLRQTRDALGQAQAQLFVIAETVGHSDPVEGVKQLRREHDAAWRWAEDAFARGNRFGLMVARALVSSRIARAVPFSGWFIRWAFASVTHVVDMKNGGKSSGLPVRSEGMAASESPT